MTGLPDSIKALLFDLDGVLTGTAELHKQAWKRTFDQFLEHRDGPGFEPFTDQDYLAHVDGRPRADGVRTFLEARDIHLPEGTPDDPPGQDTVNGVGNHGVQATVTDNGEPGVNDQFGLQVVLPNGTIRADLTSAPTLIYSGNIQVPPGTR